MSSELLSDKGSAAPAGSMRELMHLAFPLMVSAGSLSLMNAVDRAFLAMVDIDALAASMPAAMLLWTAMSLPFGTAGYTNAFVAQYEGAQRKDRVAASVWQGLAVALLGGLFAVPFALLAPDIFAFMGHTTEVQKLEVSYFRYLAPAAVPMLICTVLSSFFAARKEASVVMWVNVATSLLNAVLDYLLIFGKGPFPELGMRGAALATVIAQSISAIMFALLLIRRSKLDGYPLWETFGLDPRLIKRILRYGVPNGVQMALDVGAFMTFLAVIGRLGTHQQAATNLAFTLNSLAFVPMMGMGTAVLTLVGRRVGEEQPALAKHTVNNAMLVSTGYMLAFAAIYLTIPEIILSPFLHGDEQVAFEEIAPVVIDLLKFVAIYTLFDAMAVVYGSAIRGAGDTRFSMYFTVIAGWCVMVVPTIWAVKYGQGIYICWAAATAFIITLGVGFYLRYLTGKWEHMKVIEHHEEFDLP